jgi:hypothetical protein
MRGGVSLASITFTICPYYNYFAAFSDESAGGATGMPQWGKIWLACLNLYAWDGVNPVPAELWYVVLPVSCLVLYRIGFYRNLIM